MGCDIAAEQNVSIISNFSPLVSFIFDLLLF